MKTEIEVFIANIFLRVLESRSTSYDQKSLVLEALHALCVDPLLITSLFLNYDCDFDAVDLYKNIVTSLTRVSQGKMKSRTGSHTELEQESELAISSLEVLIKILRALLKLLELPGGIAPEDTAKNILLKSIVQLDIGVAAIPSKVRLQKKSSIMSEDRDEHFSDTLDRKRSRQQHFEVGVVRFKQSIKKGLHYFVQHDFITMDAREVAEFILENRDILDKTAVGDLLGREHEYGK